MQHDEEMTLESTKKRQDVQEVMDETAWKATRGREEYARRLEPEGETEMPETRIVTDGVEGVPVNPDGEGRHERVQANSSRRESEAPGEEGEGVESSKRKVIRVESEETLDCVTEAKDLSQEEAEEISFVPSAVSVPQKPFFRCDNRCSEKPSVFGSLRWRHE